MIDIEFRPVKPCAIAQNFHVGKLPPRGMLQAFQHFPLQHKSFAGTHLQDEHIQARAVVNFADARCIRCSLGALDRMVDLGTCRNDFRLCNEFPPINITQGSLGY